MNKICTDVYQSKKLLKLGLDPITADMHYGEYYASGIEYSIPNCDDNYNGTSAWSLSALLNLIPNPKLSLATENDWKLVYGIGELDCDGQFEDFDSFYDRTPVDVAFKTLVYLIESKRIKTDKNENITKYNSL